MTNKEEFRAVKDFEGLYEVSNYGKVKSLKRKKERILKPSISRNNYYTVILCKDSKFYPRLVHRLVAESFLPNPQDKPIIDHLDGNSLNNCVDNLKWVTQKENCLNPITRENNSRSKKGHKCYLDHHSEETKKKLSDIHKGKKLSDETKKKLSESHLGLKKGVPNTFLKGKHWKIEGGKRVWY